MSEVTKTTAEEAPKAKTADKNKEVIQSVSSNLGKTVDAQIMENKMLIRRMPVEVIIHVGRGTPTAKEIRCDEVSAAVKHMAMETK